MKIKYNSNNIWKINIIDEQENKDFIYTYVNNCSNWFIKLINFIFGRNNIDGYILQNIYYSSYYYTEEQYNDKSIINEDDTFIYGGLKYTKLENNKIINYSYIEIYYLGMDKPTRLFFKTEKERDEFYKKNYILTGIDKTLITYNENY